MSRTRIEYTQALRQVQDLVLSLGSMVDRQIDRAVSALEKQDVELANQVIEWDNEVNEVRWQIENQTLTIIATQAPMASDLRRILASVHIATNLERMGDHAEGIARLVLRTPNQPLLKPLVDVPEMARIARLMLKESLDAFVDGDVERAREIAGYDDRVDDLYERVYHELLEFMIKDQTTVSRATHLLWVAHNLERIADRVTNVCERVIFVTTGEFEEVNRKDFHDSFADTN